MAVLDAGPLRGLRHRPFRVLWSTNFVTQVGFWMANVALQWQVNRLTGGDSLALGLLYFANLIPLLFVTPFAGVAADQLNRRRIVVTGNLAIGGLALLAALLLRAGVGTLLPLLVLAFGLGSLLAFNAPAGQALTANTVPPDDLGSAVSLQSAALNLARIAGPAAATPVLVAWGAAPAFLGYAATSFFTALVVSQITVERQAVGATAPVLRRLRDGFAHARERRPALTALAMVGVSALFCSSYVALLPIFATDVLHAGDTAFTALVIATGAGAAVGALVSGVRTRPHSIRVLAAVCLALCAALVGFSQVTVFGLSLVLAAACGALNFALMTGLNAVLQHAVDDELRGRVMSLYVLAWGGLIPVGALALGGLARWVGPAGAVSGFAVVAAGYAAVLLVRGARPAPGAALAAPP